MTCCFKCGRDNAVQARCCGACGARFPWVSRSTTSAFELMDGHQYQAPSQNYPNLLLDDLENCLEAFFLGHLEDDEVFDSAQELETRASSLLEVIPEVLEVARMDQQATDDPRPHQVHYLLATGSRKLNRGLDQLRLLLEGVTVEMEPVLATLRRSNDYLCEAGLLAQTMLDEAV